MKKIFFTLVVTILGLSLVACTSSEEDEAEKVNNKQEIVLTQEEEKQAIETINLMCETTAYDSSEIILKTEQQDEVVTVNNVLKVIVIKPEKEVLDYYSEKIPETDAKESIKKSLTLDTAISAVNEKNSKISEFDRIVAVLYSTQDDYKNNNSYAVDVLEID